MIITQQDRINFRNSLEDPQEYDEVQVYIEEFKEKLKLNPEEPETELNEKGNEWDERFLEWMAK